MERFSVEYASRVALSISVVLLAYAYYTYSRFYKRWSSLPSFQPHSLLSFARVFLNFDNAQGIPSLFYIYQLMYGFSQIVKEGICLYWVSFTPYVFVYKSSIVKELICHPNAQDKSDVYRFYSTFLGKGLVTANGDHWHNHRKLISPAFNIEHLKEYISIFNEQAEVLTTKLKDSLEKPWINISHYIHSCSFDIITESTLGVKLGCQHGGELATVFVRSVDAVADITSSRIYRPWTHSDFLCSFFSLGQKIKELKKFSIDFVNKIINEKKEALLLKKKSQAEEKVTDTGTSKKTKSFLETLLNCHIENSNFTITDIHDEVNTMIGAGHETVALTMAWAVYLVGLYPDVQENVIQELDTIFQNDLTRLVTYDDLRDMVYLSSVIKEALRVYPTVPIIARKPRADIQVENYLIPKGSEIIFSVQGMYRDPEIFPEPEKFKPERFLPENARNIPQFAFIPFSAGSRSCIGQKFAMMEMKVILSSIFRNFKVESLDERDKVTYTWGMTLKSIGPIRIRLTPRQ